jgi:serine/threonine protein kinase/WD40 repeat protein
VSLGTARVIFDAAMELPSGERRGFVARACAGAKTMEEKVLALLAAHEDVGQFMGAPENPVGAARPALEAAGDQIGPFRLLSVLGEGGFGTVWLAERREPFVQRVAMKILKPGMDSRAVIGRFEQERQSLAAMDHPNVAKVIDGGLTPLGRPYFVMELIKGGEPITEFCDKNRLTIRERLELFVSVCEAVQHAHMKGLIHRDLKPGNILVSVVDTGAGHTPKDDTADRRRPDSGPVHGLVKVIDFGVAKAISPGLASKTIFTTQGQLIGTPEYMAPEQADGKAIDTSTDVYSLGVVLYELLTGALPFDPRALRSQGFNEIQRIIREVEPPKPSMRLTSLDLDRKELPAGAESALDIASHRHARLNDLVRELRRELDWVPLMAMRKDPHQRYQTALSVAEDIKNYLRGLPLKAGPESARYRARKFVKRHRWGVGVTAAALVGLAGFSGVIWELYIDAVNAKHERERSGYKANIIAAGASVELGNVEEARRRLDDCKQEKLRDWEWRYLDWRTDWSAAKATGVRPSMVRFAPNGGVMFAWIDGGDKEVGVSFLDAGLTGPGAGTDWHVLAATRLDRVLGMDALGGVVLANPMTLTEGPWLASRQGAGEIQDAKGDGHEAGSVSPDGKHAMVSADVGSQILLVDTATGKVVASPSGLALGGWFGGGDKLMTFDGNGVRRYGSGDGGLVEPAGELNSPDLPRPDGRTGWPQLAASDDGKVALVCGPGGAWTIGAGKLPVERVAIGTTKSPWISGDGTLCAWIDGQGLSVRALATGHVRHVGVPGTPQSVALSADGRRLLAGTLLPNAVLEWNLADDSPVDWGAGAFTKAIGAGGAFGDAPLLVDGELAGGGPWLRIVRLDGRETKVESGDKPVDAMCAAEDGTVIAFADWEGRLRVCSAASGAEIKAWDVSVAAGRARVESMAFVGTTGDLVMSLAGTSGPVEVVAFGLDGKIRGRLGEFDRGSARLVAGAGASRVVAAAAGLTLKIWPGVEGKEEVCGLPMAALALALDKDGTRVAVGLPDGGVIICARGGGVWGWRRMDAKHRDSVNTLTFTPDGGRLLTGSEDGTVIVSDPASGAALLTVDMESPVLHLSFPGGNDRALAAMKNGSIRRLWAPSR